MEYLFERLKAPCISPSMGRSAVQEAVLVLKGIVCVVGSYVMPFFFFSVRDRVIS